MQHKIENLMTKMNEMKINNNEYVINLKNQVQSLQEISQDHM